MAAKKADYEKNLPMIEQHSKRVSRATEEYDEHIKCALYPAVQQLLGPCSHESPRATAAALLAARRLSRSAFQLVTTEAEQNMAMSSHAELLCESCFGKASAPALLAAECGGRQPAAPCWVEGLTQELGVAACPVFSHGDFTSGTHFAGSRTRWRSTSSACWSWPRRRSKTETSKSARLSSVLMHGCSG